MKLSRVYLMLCVVLAVACSGRDDPDREPPVPEASEHVMFPPSPTAVVERPPIDLGDVDSGVFILGTLAPESETADVTADYIETMRNTLSMATITVHPPFPEQLLVQFEVVAWRAFEERPVVVRVRAYREDDEMLGEEHAYLMGRDANQEPIGADGRPQPRAFVVNALDGMDAVPDTMLLYARADAWLMEENTAEELLDPRVAASPERVTLISNPVRINFESPEDES